MAYNEGATEIEDLATDHEEADTKIAHLIQHTICGSTAIRVETSAKKISHTPVMWFHFTIPMY